MDDKINFNSTLLNKFIATRHTIWQMGFLDETKLSQFTRDRGIGFTNTHILQLWKLKLLRADLIKSADKVHLKGLQEAGKDEFGYYIYTDDRKLEQHTGGWGDAFRDIDHNQLNFSILFHPFRFYMLYHFNRILNSTSHPTHILIPTDTYKDLIEDNINIFSKWSAKTNFIKLISYWDNITSLAIITEPCVYGKIFGLIRFPISTNLSEQRKLIDEHWQNITPLYKKLKKSQIDDIRRDVCTNAEILDPNKNIHTMIRLMKGSDRLKIKGKLGGAIYLLIMAEMIRLAAEKINNIELKEEDEMGFGVIPNDLKRRLYGGDRILTGDRKVAKNFMSQFGLDYGVKIKFYLEGDTEFGAIESIFGHHNAFELINLSGEFAVSRRKGLTFKGDLRNDVKSSRFSVILLDNDSPYNLQLVRNAAEKDEICGLFYISDPDFEFGNFSLKDLEIVLCRMEEGKKGKAIESQNELHRAVNSADSGKEFFKLAQRVPEFRQSNKNANWGKHLINYAYESKSKKSERIIDFINKVVKLAGCEYHYYRENFRVNPMTGELERRDK